MFRNVLYIFGKKKNKLLDLSYSFSENLRSEKSFNIRNNETEHLDELREYEKMKDKITSLVSPKIIWILVKFE